MPCAFVFHFSIALVSVAVGLILFLVPGVLSFAFSMRIILITRWCFGCCSAVLTQKHGLGWPVLCQQADAEGAGRDHVQELAKGRFHNRTSCPVHKLGSAGWELPVPAGERVGHCSVSSYTVHCLFLSGFNSLSLFPYVAVIIVLFYFASVIKLFLSLLMRFTVSLWFSSPLGAGRWTGSDCVVPSCWLGLSHKYVSYSCGNNNLYVQ